VVVEAAIEPDGRCPHLCLEHEPEVTLAHLRGRIGNHPLEPERSDPDSAELLSQLPGHAATQPVQAVALVSVHMAAKDNGPAALQLSLYVLASPQAEETVPAAKRRIGHGLPQGGLSLGYLPADHFTPRQRGKNLTSDRAIGDELAFLEQRLDAWRVENHQ